MRFESKVIRVNLEKNVLIMFVSEKLSIHVKDYLINNLHNAYTCIVYL